MLELTGFVKNKQYDEEVLSADKMATLFGVPFDLSKREAVFTVLSQYVKDDPVNKRKRHQRVKQFTTAINGTFEGDFITIRYYQRKRKGKEKVTYDPPRAKLIGLEMPVKTKEDKELIVFLMLCGHNKNSPIKTTSTKYYEFTDKAKKAQLELDTESLIATLIVEVNNMNEMEVKRLSRAISLSGTSVSGDRILKRGVGGVNTKTITELKSELIKIAKLLPKEFAANYKDPDILLRGLLKEATAKNIIIRRNVGNGNVMWEWNESINGGAQICSAKHIEDPYEVLYRYVLRPDVFTDFTSIVNRNLGYAEVEERINTLDPMAVQTAIGTDVDALTELQLVGVALQSDKIYLDRNEKKVYILENGEPQKKALHVVSDLTLWKEELAEGMQQASIKKNKLLSALKS